MGEEQEKEEGGIQCDETIRRDKELSKIIVWAYEKKWNSKLIWITVVKDADKEEPTMREDVWNWEKMIRKLENTINYVR